MKIKLPILLLLTFSSGIVKFANAQLYNNGATITVQNGAYIMAMGDIKNTSGTITNDGKIEVQGNFVNSGTYNSTANEDSLIMTGAGVDTLTGGGASINYLIINKTASTDVVRLGGTTVVNTKLDYTSGLLTTDPLLNPTFSLTSPVAAVYNFTAGREIIGSVKRTGWSNGTARVFNQPNMLVTTNSGTTPTDLTVTMLPQAGSGDPTDNEREVKRKFQFAQTGGTGFTADVRFPYIAGELNTNTEANLVSWGRFSGEWNGKLTSTRDVAQDWVTTTAISQTDLINEWKLADPKYTFNVTAQLRGTWNSGTQLMNTNINSIIQTNQPYNDIAFNSYNGGEFVAANFFTTHTNIVDWVLIDYRKPFAALPANATFSESRGRRAAFLLNNGTVVDLDGVTPIAFDIDKQGSGFIVLKHRNHLGTMSNAIPSNATGTFTNDYSAFANNYFNLGLTNDPVQLLPSSSPIKYGMWAGNANKDLTINAGDIGLVKANSNVALTGYVFGDVNMDGTVNAGDIGITKLSVNGAPQSHSSKTTVVTKNKEPKNHIPSN